MYLMSYFFNIYTSSCDNQNLHQLTKSSATFICKVVLVSKCHSLNVNQINIVFKYCVLTVNLTTIFQHVHRQILGDHIYAAVDSSMRGDYSNGKYFQLPPNGNNVTEF